MNCLSCQKSFNNSDYCPRLLVNCGHSICESCLESIFSSGTVICPECNIHNYAPKLSAFPVNLSLISIKSTASSVNTQRDHLQKKSSGEEANQSLCLKHKKKIEAFCERSRVLLCINCILDDKNKDHELNSISTATLKERELLSKARELSRLIEGKLEMLQVSIQNANQKLDEAAENAQVEITQFYNQIRKTLSEREAYLKQQVLEHYKQEDANLKAQREHVSNHLQNIQELYSEIEKSENEDELNFLSKSNFRLNIIRKATINIEELTFEIPFSEIDREQEITHLVKLLNPKQAIPKSETQSTATQNAQNKYPRIINVTQMMLSGASKKSLKPSTVRESTNKAQASKTTNLKKATNRSRDERAVDSEHEAKKHFVSLGFAGGSAKGKRSPASKGQVGNTAKPEPTFFEPKPLKRDVDEFVKPYETEAIQAVYNFDQGHLGSRSCSPHKNVIPSEGQRFQARSTNLVGGMPRNHWTEAHRTDTTGNSYCSHSINKTLLFQADRSPHLNINEQDTKIKQRFEPKIDDPGNDDSLFENQEFLDLLTHQPKETPFGQINQLDLSEIRTVPRSSDATQREIKSILLETANKVDVSELTQQKLDFSMLCLKANPKFVVLGGFIEDSEGAIEKFDSSKLQWETLPTKLSNRTKFAAISLSNGSVLVLGGKQNGHRVATCEEVSLVTESVAISPIKLTAPKSGFGAISIEDDIFVCGGNDGTNVLKGFEVLSSKTGKWTALNPMKYKRDEHAIAYGLDKRLYAIGGFGGPKNICLSTVERYDFKTGNWQPVADMNVPRRALGVVTMPDGIYAIGGFDGENFLGSVERYDETLNEWVFVSSMNYPRCTFAVITSPDNHSIYVFGGFDDGPLNTVERYPIISGTWEVMTPMKYKRFMHCCALANVRS